LRKSFRAARARAFRSSRGARRPFPDDRTCPMKAHLPPLFACALCAIAAAARAQTPAPMPVPEPELPAYIEAASENDLYSTVIRNDDRWYTNGLRVEYGFGSAAAAAPLLGFWLPHLADRLCGRACAPKPGDMALDTLAAALVSNTYTPSDTQRLEPDPRDRPYAGVLYVSQIYDRAIVREGRSRAQRRLSIDLGVLGPASGAGEIQRWWHRRIGVAVPRGWATQIGDEPVLQLSWAEERRVLSWGDGVELWARGRAQLGTLRAAAAGGGQIRLGFLGRRLDGRDGTAPLVSALYATLAAEARVVGFEATIDGALFGDGSQVSSRTLVGQWSFGAVLEVKERVRITYAYFERTREFSGPLARRYGYGSIAVRLVLPLN
jgi:hypothetical protein